VTLTLICERSAGCETSAWLSTEAAGAAEAAVLSGSENRAEAVLKAALPEASESDASEFVFAVDGCPGKATNRTMKNPITAIAAHSSAMMAYFHFEWFPEGCGAGWR